MEQKQSTGSLEASDAAAAAVAKTEARVTLDSIRAKVATVEYHHPNVAGHMTVAFVRMENGFIVIGKSAPADPLNFDAELGHKFALEDALRQVWALEGYLLCEKLTEFA
jgi:hypothetical protein